MPSHLIQLAPGNKDTLARAMLQLLDRPDAVGRLMTAMGGKAFEEWILSKAESESLRCEDLTGRKLPYDLVVNGHRIQAKSSSSKSGIVDVRPSRPVAGSMCRRYALSDFDILAVYLARYEECFFIPAKEFECREFNGMVAGCFNRKKHYHWKDAWHVVLSLSGPAPTQKRMFD